MGSQSVSQGGKKKEIVGCGEFVDELCAESDPSAKAERGQICDGSNHMAGREDEWSMMPY